MSLGELFWAMVWFGFVVLWIWLVITVFSDIFRSEDIGGWGKALWSLFIIFLPYLGVFVYLIARGRSMQERALADAKARDAATRSYIRDAAGTPSSPAGELERLAHLRDQGVIDDTEFQSLKAKALA